MARRRSQGNREGGVGEMLFDLPLRPDTEPDFDDVLGGENGPDSGAATFLETPADVDEEVGEEGAEVIPIQTKLFQHEDDDEEEDGLFAEESPIAPLADRLLGGVSDLAVHAAMLGVAAAGSYGLGVKVSLADWLPFTLLALIFSFLYWTIPLAFWGQTPGMAWIGNVARNLDDGPLSFGQAMLRWAGALLTLAFAGLPMLLSLGGRSLSDWLSESKTELV